MRKLSAFVALVWFAVPALSAHATPIEVSWSVSFPTIQTTVGGVFLTDTDLPIAPLALPATTTSPLGSLSGFTAPLLFDYNGGGFLGLSFIGGGILVPCPAPGACTATGTGVLNFVQAQGVNAAAAVEVFVLGGPSLHFTLGAPITIQTQVVPEPATAPLLVAGLAGVGLWRRRAAAR